MYFICESCRRKRDSIYRQWDADLYVCWRCLSDASKLWHEMNQTEVNEYHKNERRKEIDKRRIHPDTLYQ